MIIYFVAHMLGDYYFQSQALSDYKEISVYGVLIHSIIYSLSFLLVFFIKYIFIMINSPAWFSQHFVDLVLKEFLFVFVVTGIHALIDYLKYKLIFNEKRKTVNIHLREDALNRYLNQAKFSGFKNIAGKDPLSFSAPGYIKSPLLFTFLVDQFLHVVSILFLYQSFFPNVLSQNLLFTPWIQKSINFLFLVLLIGKPSNVFITIVSARYMPDNNNEVGVQGAGAFIGFLERLLIIIFLKCNLNQGIATVYVLKGFARHKKISDDAQFAEYFVLGSFLSMLMIVISLYFYKVI